MSEKFKPNEEVLKAPTKRVKKPPKATDLSGKVTTKSKDILEIKEGGKNYKTLPPSEEEIRISLEDPLFYEYRKTCTYLECINEIEVLDRIVYGGFELDDRKELKVKLRILNIIAIRKQKELQLNGLPIPTLPVPENPLTSLLIKLKERRTKK